MKILLIVMLLFLSPAASAREISAPPVPEMGQQYMPSDTTRLDEGLWEILTESLGDIRPDLAEAGGICLSIISLVLLLSLTAKIGSGSSRTGELAFCIGVSFLLLENTNSLISLAVDTVGELHEYGKLLVGVMASAHAAQGGVSGSAVLYSGTVLFISFLNTLIRRLLIPMIYILLALAIAGGALGEELLKKLASTVKWACTWSLKTILYIFTGYMSLTGVISGSADAATLKAAKLTISGCVPVVGGILSDASEAVLVGAGLMKHSAGIYGILALISVTVGPFLKIAVHYLLMKMTAAACHILGSKSQASLLDDFSGIMGILLGATGAVCLLLMISMVCFLMGVG